MTIVFEWILANNVAIIVGFGAVVTTIGLIFRHGPSAKTDRDSLIFADGFQGASIATLFIVAIMVYIIADPRAVQVLKEQASIIATYSLLGCIQIADRFRRSLSQ